LIAPENKKAHYVLSSRLFLNFMGWLMGLHPNSAKNLLKPAPALTFAFSSRLKNR
jgi:hypothetical protein